MSGGRRLRIAYARVAQETNALSPLRTTLDDFRRTHLVEGAALARACGRFGYEAPGFLRAAELTGFARAARSLGDGRIDAVPLFSAWTIPGGPLSTATFAALRERLVDELRACGHLDGVFLSLHGAMGADGCDDPDGELLRAARAAVGEGVPIAATYDLHANMTDARVRAANVSVAYHTNPHRDHARTGRKAGELLVRTARGEARPVTAWRSLPMLLGGGNTLDFLAPMRPIFARMRAMERERNVLSASTFMAHPWLDVPEVGWSTLVTTDGDVSQAERLADELAERCWAVRNEQPPAFSSPEAAIDVARGARLARRLGAVVLSDASDVVTAGATGDSTALIKALLARARGMRCYAPLRDPSAIETLFAHAVGDRVSLSVGGTLDPARHAPLAVDGVLRHLATRDDYGGRVAVLEVDHVSLVITDAPPLTVRPSFFGAVGLDPWRADILVVKNFFPFRIFFAPVARKTIYVKTRGTTDLDAAFALPRIEGPVHPRDAVSDWRAVDRRRRGL